MPRSRTASWAIAIVLAQAGCEEAEPDFADEYWDTLLAAVRDYCEAYRDLELAPSDLSEETKDVAFSSCLTPRSLGTVGPHSFPGSNEACGKRVFRQSEFVDTARALAECDTPLIEDVQACILDRPEDRIACAEQLLPERMACFDAGGELARELELAITRCISQSQDGG